LLSAEWRTHNPEDAAANRHRNRPFLDRKAALAHLLYNVEARILLNEHIANDGSRFSRTSCRRIR
jgi:hypothetical protein